jgi:hypothetical protein
MNTPDPRDPESPPVRLGPIVTWEEPSPMAYRVVELPAAESTRIKPLEWVARPAFADAPDLLAPEEPDEEIYRLAGPLEPDRAKTEHRHYQERQLRQQLVVSRKLLRPVRRRAVPLEKHWYQCLVLPYLGWKHLLALGAGLAFSAILLLPGAGNELLPWHLRYLLPLTFVIWTCGLLQGVLSGAVAGSPPTAVWPPFHVSLRYAGWWAYTFLIGPAPVGLGMLYYWIHCGDLEFLDELILAQAGVLAVSYWLFALVALTRSGRLWDANPLRVAQLVHELAYRAAVAIVLVSFLAYEHGLLLLFAVELAHQSRVAGWLLLTLYLTSALTALAFVLRLVGWWCYRSSRTRSLAGMTSASADC